MGKKAPVSRNYRPSRRERDREQRVKDRERDIEKEYQYRIREFERGEESRIKSLKRDLRDLEREPDLGERKNGDDKKVMPAAVVDISNDDLELELKNESKEIEETVERLLKDKNKGYPEVKPEPTAEEKEKEDDKADKGKEGENAEKTDKADGSKDKK